MMAETTRFDARRCLLGDRAAVYMHKKGLEPPNPKTSASVASLSKMKMFNNFLAETDRPKMSTDLLQKGEAVKFSSYITYGLPRPQPPKRLPVESWKKDITLKNSQAVADRQLLYNNQK
jgi:hypothetical protein